MQIKELTIPYTICFCTKDDEVLMIRRNKPPHQNKWNGIGGKIEKDEEPIESVQREIMEEAGINIEKGGIRYVGLVTWGEVSDPDNSNQGMYAFVADATKQDILWQSLNTPEGLLAWKRIDEMSDKSNLEVAKNVPHFLPQLLTSAEPALYHCVFENREFREVVMQPLPSEYSLASLK